MTSANDGNEPVTKHGTGPRKAPPKPKGSRKPVGGKSLAK